MNNEFIVHFWGVRGSYPTPGRKTIQIGGNTSCIELRIAGHIIIVDAGTGIIKLGDKMMKEHISSGRKPMRAYILLTHMHQDHNQGFPFFKPAYIPTSDLYFFGPRVFQKDIADLLSDTMLNPYFPVEIGELASMQKMQNISENQIIYICDKFEGPRVHTINVDNNFDEYSNCPDLVTIRLMIDTSHPGGRIIFYKVTYNNKFVVIATDTEGYQGGNKKLIEFAKGADLLIHDAQFEYSEYASKKHSKQGYGHSTPEMAVEVAREAEVKMLVLYHHDPTHDDETIKRMEADAQRIFPNTISAFEGLEIKL